MEGGLVSEDSSCCRLSQFKFAAGPGLVRFGEARLGKARRGWAWLGMAWHGKAGVG